MPPPVGLKRDQTRPQAQLDAEGDPVFSFEFKGPTILRRVLLNSTVQLVAVFLVAALVFPLLLYYLLMPQAPPLQYEGSCSLNSLFRVDCLPGVANITEDVCSSAKCCWDQDKLECYHPLLANHGYQITGWNSSEEALKQAQSKAGILLDPIIENTPLGSPALPLKLVLSTITESHLKILITPDTKAQGTTSNVTLEESDFVVSLEGPKFVLHVGRRVDNDSSEDIFSTEVGALLHSETYRELSLRLPTNSSSWGPLLPLRGEKRLLYSGPDHSVALPFMMTVEDDGYTWGLWLESTGPMETSRLSGSPVISMRGLSSMAWEVHILSGPTPALVSAQAATLWEKPVLPPFWALGLHVCPSLSSSTTSERTNITGLVLDTLKHLENVSWDSTCLVKELIKMTGVDELQELMRSIVLNEQKVLISVPSYQCADESNTTCPGNDLLVKASNGSSAAYVGTDDDDNNAVYLDWTLPTGPREWQDNMLKNILSPLADTGLLGGYSLVDNWPLDYSQHFPEDLDYVPAEQNHSISDGTLPWLAMHYSGKSHYEVHDRIPVLQAGSLRSSTSLFVTSAATTPGVGSVAGVHYTGASVVPATWATLRESLAQALELGLAGVHVATAPICGNEFSEAPLDPDLCLRWYQVSALLPMAHVSSPPPYRDPVSIGKMSPGDTLSNILRALDLRCRLLAYIHSAVAASSVSGVPVVRPSFYEHPADNETRAVNYGQQFWLGSALLVLPVLTPATHIVHLYVPPGLAPLFHLMGGERIDQEGTTVDVVSLKSEIVVLVKAGSIVPLQDVDLSASAARRKNLTLVVALSCNDTCSASGDLFLGDQGSTTDPWLRFTATDTSVTVENLAPQQGTSCPEAWPFIETVRLYGRPGASDFVEFFNVNYDRCHETNSVISFTPQQ